MHAELYSFTHSDGQVVEFGAGDHLRVWRNIPGPAHELLAAYNGRCFHSPGPGDAFVDDDLADALNGARVVEVVSRAENIAEADRRIERALQIIGKPWDALFSNCQDTVSWIVTGKAESFQRDAVLGLALGFSLLVLVGAAISTLGSRRHR